jgi:hypothetical protein
MGERARGECARAASGLLNRGKVPIGKFSADRV